jgi:hypothetical protein
MGKEWLDHLAEEIRSKNRNAAEEYGRAQHYAGIISTAGKKFFVALVFSLQEDVDALRSKLQGDPTSSETRFQQVKGDEVKITRARFPWIDARLTHKDETILLDYAKGPGVEGDAALERKSRAFAFKVAPDDSLYVEDAFADTPAKYETPDGLARQMMELLFSV